VPTHLTGRSGGVRRLLTLLVPVALLSAGCGHAPSRGVVDGFFRLPGGSAADLRRGGLNFAKASEGAHGNGAGHTVRVGADGRYTVTLPSGSYSVIGALSGQPGRIVPETCGASINVVVRANSTTRVDFVCHASPVTTPTSAPKSAP
jgi:hypothetical protein